MKPARRIAGAVLLLLVVCAGACAAAVLAADGGDSKPATTTHHRAAPSPPAPGATSTYVPDSPAAATEALGIDLLGALRAENLVVSPDSVATALAMAGTGAHGLTEEQIGEVLRLEGLPFTSLGDLQKAIVEDAPEVKIATGLFAQSGLRLRPKFVGGLGEHFGAAPESLDFEGDPQGSLEAINSWAGEHTGGVIPKLFSELPPETRLVLADAVYLKALWQRRFAVSGSYDGPFYRKGGRTQAKFMSRTGRTLYAAGPDFKAVELPYRGSTLSMLVVLPVGEELAALERRLGETGLRGIVAGLSPERVELSLPRFHIESETELAPALGALGMPDAFGDGADFSGITGAEHLKIDAVKQIADIRVDEKGTEAAAVTGVVVVPTSAEAPRRQVVFDADHPFLFFVRDDETGALLFAGRLADPATARAG
jgi:serpin B